MSERPNDEQQVPSVDVHISKGQVYTITGGALVGLLTLAVLLARAHGDIMAKLSTLKDQGERNSMAIGRLASIQAAVNDLDKRTTAIEASRYTAQQAIADRDRVSDAMSRLRVIEAATRTLEKRVDDHQDGHPGRVVQMVAELARRLDRLEDSK